MQFLRDWFSGGHSPIVETDEVYPLYFLDNLAAGRDSVLSETLRYNHVLDANKLHSGLIKLIQHGGNWRKLGGRLRLRPDGSVEIHVPREFTEDRPAVQFTSQSFDIPIEDHKLGSQLPKLTDTPSLHPGPRSFDSFNPIPDCPDKLRDYVYSDRPILRLHVTSFTNSTLVTLIWPHVVAGGLGVKEIISAWSKTLHSDDDIPALLGTDKDVLDGIGTDKDNPVPYHLGPSEIKGWGFVKFALRLVWEVLMHPQVESRAICLPRQFLSQLRESCLNELRAVHQGDSAPFLSEGDVLEAWGARFIAQARGGERPALIITSLDVQSRLGAPWGTDGIYVQNTAGCVYTTIEPEILLRRPLGELAHVIRQSIHKAATDEQIRAQLRIFRTLGHTGTIPIFGSPDSHLMSFSNWTKFNIFNAADFSPAILPTASSVSNSTPIGKPTYMHCQALGENRLLRNCYNITGKDWDGNYWFTVFLYPEDWVKLERYIDQTCQHLKKLNT
ncbi:hypothetical protein EV127DRAFT_213976 [Xylaria flabelliformis]|nr:hypothetical protein EV127DRAFT_213976 [Xylaria flabelliformis]